MECSRTQNTQSINVTCALFELRGLQKRFSEMYINMRNWSWLMNINVKTEDVFRNTVPLLLCPLDLSENLGNLACLEKWNYCSACVATCLSNLNIGSHASSTWVRCLNRRSRQCLRCCSCLLVNFWFVPIHTTPCLKGEFFTWKLSVQLTPEISTPFLKGFCCWQNREVTVKQLASSVLNTWLRLWGCLYHECIFLYLEHVEHY